MVSTETARRTVGAARHVCEIFDCFTAERTRLSLTEIATAIGLRKSSVYHLAQTLVREGYLAVDAHERRYRVGPKIGRLVDVFRETTSLATVARPFLDRIRDVTGETSALQVLDGDARSCLVELPAPSPIRMVLGENVRYSARKGASGHVLRAFAPDWERQRDRVALARVRSAGYAASHGEIIPDAVAVYVPVLDRAGFALAALGVHGPAFRLTDARVDTIVPLLRDAAEALAATR